MKLENKEKNYYDLPVESYEQLNRDELMLLLAYHLLIIDISKSPSVIRESENKITIIKGLLEVH